MTLPGKLLEVRWQDGRTVGYLLVTSVDQGREPIKARDFQNLMGRVGRSGMFTEGSVIFTDPDIYGLKSTAGDGWRFQRVAKLLRADSVQPCDRSLCVSALIEVVGLIAPDEPDLAKHLAVLQKRLRYGLSRRRMIRIFEAGFTDRVIAMKLSAALELGAAGETKKIMQENEPAVRKILKPFSCYVETVLEGIVAYFYLECGRVYAGGLAGRCCGCDDVARLPIHSAGSKKAPLPAANGNSPVKVVRLRRLHLDGRFGVAAVRSGGALAASRPAFNPASI